MKNPSPHTGDKMTTSSVLEQWYPVTFDFGLIDAPVEVVCQYYKSWWTNGGKEVLIETTTGLLAEQFDALLPLTIGKNRALILPTNSNWTAFYRNGIQGSDPSSAIPVFARQLHVRTMRLCIAKKPQKYQGVIWEVYEPNLIRGEPANTRRSIVALNDGGKWIFETSGVPFSFEKTDRYTLPRKRDRFTGEMLIEYASHFGVEHIGDSMFRNDGRLEGRLVSFPNWEHAKNFTLEEVKSGVPWER